MKCQVKSCGSKATWERTSIATQMKICNRHKIKLDEEFESMNSISAIKWYTYRKIRGRTKR